MNAGSIKKTFLFRKCERPLDFNFFLGNDLTGRKCDLQRTASICNCSIIESLNNLQSILETFDSFNCSSTGKLFHGKAAF